MSNNNNNNKHNNNKQIVIIPKPESVLEQETHILLWDFEIQVEHQIPARNRLKNLELIRKKTCYPVNLAVPVDLREKIKENEEVDKYLDLARELKKKEEN